MEPQAPDSQTAGETGQPPSAAPLVTEVDIQHLLAEAGRTWNVLEHDLTGHWGHQA